jgi:hypothetical protein
MTNSQLEEMMKARLFSIVLVIMMLLVAVGPVSAQLGDTDVSSFTIQNVSTTQATVTVTFVAEDGTTYTPPTLDRGRLNPFFIDGGAAAEIYVPGIPAGGLPAGRYSVIASSDQPIVAIANMLGQGAVNFNGSYSGFDEGAPVFYLTSITYNFYGWYSLISVQNVGQDTTDVTVTINCVSGAVGTYTKTGLVAGAAVTFDLKATLPAGFVDNVTRCDGAAVVSSTGDVPIVAVDNERVPTVGNTQSYDGFSTGAMKLYIPALYVNYYGWNANLNIRKIGDGVTTVTVSYSDGADDFTCALTNTAPACSIYMPTKHGATHPGHKSMFGATIVSDNLPIVGSANAANGSQAQTYNAVAGGTAQASITAVYKWYYGWASSFTCQNVGTVATALNITYAGRAANAYNTAVLQPGETKETYQPSEAFLPNNYIGAVTVKAVDAGGTPVPSAQIACIANFTHGANIANPSFPGDWSMSINGNNQ